MDEKWLSEEYKGVSRINFLLIMGVAGASLAGCSIAAKSAGVSAIAIKDLQQNEDVFAYISREKGGFDLTLYQQVIGAANDFKEGDETIGVGAKDEATRQNARSLLANTKIKDLY